jgi:hypothetical protein
LLQKNPSLQSYPEQVLAESYQDAVEVASKETGLKTLPWECPYSLDQILDDRWLPH